MIALIHQVKVLCKWRDFDSNVRKKYFIFKCLYTTFKTFSFFHIFRQYTVITTSVLFRKKYWNVQFFLSIFLCNNKFNKVHHTQYTHQQSRYTATKKHQSPWCQWVTTCLVPQPQRYYQCLVSSFLTEVQFTFFCLYNLSTVQYSNYPFRYFQVGLSCYSPGSSAVTTTVVKQWSLKMVEHQKLYNVVLYTHKSMYT